MLSGAQEDVNVDTTERGQTAVTFRVITWNNQTSHLQWRYISMGFGSFEKQGPGKLEEMDKSAVSPSATSEQVQRSIPKEGFGTALT